MSRSKPTDTTPNPSTRWHEWNGEIGNVRYYDKDAKANVDVPLPFSFILLDQLSSVGGWNEASGSSIYSNEVRDTRTDILVVKSFKGGIIDTGLYKDIKDHVTSKAVGSQFVANLYIAYKRGNELTIGALRLKGAALGAWMEFVKAHRADLYTGAITIDSSDEGKKGRIIFRTPTFRTVKLSKESQDIAIALDRELQTYLDGYLARTTADKVEPAAQTHETPSLDSSEPPPPDEEYSQGDIDESDIGF